MLSLSSFLARLHRLIQPYADAGEAIPAEAVPLICACLSPIAAECERVESRLATDPVADDGTGKVVSLAAWSARKDAGTAS